jgi:serine/threonine-protein kinase
MGNTIAGRYEVLGPLGSGILGYVVRGRDVTTGEERAIKLFNPQDVSESARARFAREFDAITRIVHPNVVRVHEWGVHGDRPFFVMELIDGDPLDAFLRPRRPAAGAGDYDAFARTVAALFRQIADALSAVHAAGVIHRDVKPANIVVAEGPPPVAKLLDFGHAKEEDQRQLTTSGTVIGTASYIAPEQALGVGAGPPADLYSLGCMLHEALTGRPPFSAGGVVAVLMSHVNEPAPDPRTTEPRIPQGLAELCLALLRKSPGDRPPDAAAVSSALAALC